MKALACNTAGVRMLLAMQHSVSCSESTLRASRRFAEPWACHLPKFCIVDVIVFLTGERYDNGKRRLDKALKHAMAEEANETPENDILSSEDVHALEKTDVHDLTSHLSGRGIDIVKSAANLVATSHLEHARKSHRRVCLAWQNSLSNAGPGKVTAWPAAHLVIFSHLGYACKSRRPVRRTLAIFPHLGPGL